MRVFQEPPCCVRADSLTKPKQSCGGRAQRTRTIRRRCGGSATSSGERESSPRRATRIGVCTRRTPTIRPRRGWCRSCAAAGCRTLPPSGFRPVPFVRLTNFLTPAQQKRLCRSIRAGRDQFVPAMVGKDNLDRETRAAWVADRRVVRDTRPWFGPKLRSVSSHVLARLRMEALHRFRIEMHVTVHLGGGFYKRHRDNVDEENRSRTLSYVYYFHRQPRRFAGGDLLLYDTDPETHRATVDAFTRIEPRHNSLVVFPSDAYYEITPVECETRDFLDGRFTVNGWVCSREKDGAGG